ncbi:MAG: hypothetical protein HYY46_26505 [Deltaproteobacteria bacterium]|nr:hypothetical protein [Deltaproteobacteria bacterium]
MNQPVNKALLEMAAVVGLTVEEVNDCAERWKAVHGVDIRKPRPDDVSHLEDDVLNLSCLGRILERYKSHKRRPQKRKRG